MLALAGRLSGDSGFGVSHHHAGLGLVPMLPARAGVLGNIGLDILIAQACRACWRWRQDSDSYRRSMDPTPALSRWHPLPAVTAGLGEERGEDVGSTLENEGEEVSTVRRGLGRQDVSRDGMAAREAQIDPGLVVDQATGVVAPFAGADFDVETHGHSFQKQADYITGCV